jgi:hypothetical protein
MGAAWPFAKFGYLMSTARRLTGVLLGWYRVPVSSPKQKRFRIAAGWLCLLAVALLYAPMAGAALLVYGVDCCVGGFCNIPAHHHQKQQPAPSQNSAPIDCGHDMRGITPCSMSCCKDPARPALIQGAFVLPPVSFAPAVGEVLLPVQIASPLEISRFVKPLSPPPRFPASIL